MKNIFRSALLLVLVAAGLSSCKNNVPKEAKYIPNTANVVLVLDPQQLQDKLQKGGISIDTLIGRAFSGDTSAARHRAMFDELRNNSGIDWGNRFFLFTQQKTNADKSQTNTFTVIGGLKDASKLEAYLAKQDHFKGKEIKREKEYSYMVPHADALISWNKEQVIATFAMTTQKPVYDTVTHTFQQPATVSSDADLKTITDRCYMQKVSESLADQKIFTNMFKEKADGFMYASGNSSLSALSALPFQLPKLEELLKDNFTTATLSFEDGKIVWKATSYPNPMLTALLKQYPGHNVDLSLIEHYPSQDINGLIVTAFNPEIFGGLLKQLEVEGLVNSFLSKADITSQDIYKSLKGDIALVVSDLNMTGPVDPQLKTDETSMVGKKKFGHVLFNAPIGDKNSFFKLMDKAAAMGYVVKDNNGYRSGGMLSLIGVFLHADANNLIISSDSSLYVQYMAKTANAGLNKDLMKEFKDKTTVFYFDIQKTVNAYMQDSVSTSGYDRSTRTLKQTFRDMIGTAGNFDGSTIKATFEMRMLDEKQNSLVTLTSLLTDIAIDMQARKETDHSFFPADAPAIIRTN